MAGALVCGLSVLTGVLFGLAPAPHASAGNHAHALKSGSKGAGSGACRRRLHDLLMIFEVALSLVLLTGAGLAIRGLIALEQERLGYDPSHVLTFRVQIGDRYPRWASERALYEKLLDRFARAPGVEDVALNPVSGRYFQTLGTPLLRGRVLDQADILRASPVTVVSQDFAVRAFGQKSPLGRYVQVDLFNQKLPRQVLPSWTFVNSFEIAGVVGTAKNRGLHDAAEPAIFLPYTLACTPFNALFIRTRPEPMAFVRQAREVVKSLDPHAPLLLELTLQDWLDTATAYPRFATFLFGIFGTVGMLLAMAGVFSVVSYAVAHRTREFGLRMALGAEQGDVLRLVLLSTARVLALGLALGLVASIFATRTGGPHGGHGNGGCMAVRRRSGAADSGSLGCVLIAGALGYSDSADVRVTPGIAGVLCGRGEPPRNSGRARFHVHQPIARPPAGAWAALNRRAQSCS